MSLYEIVFLMRQDLSTTQVDTVTAEVSEIITQLGGTVNDTEYWGLRPLAYRVRKNRKGHYMMLNATCPPSSITELERRLRLNEDILRFMTIRVDTFTELPSAMVRQKSTDKQGSERGTDRPRPDHDSRRAPETGPTHTPPATRTAESAQDTEHGPDSGVKE